MTIWNEVKAKQLEDMVDALDEWNSWDIVLRIWSCFLFAIIIAFLLVVWPATILTLATYTFLTWLNIYLRKVYDTEDEDK